MLRCVCDIYIYIYIYVCMYVCMWLSSLAGVKSYMDLKNDPLFYGHKWIEQTNQQKPAGHTVSAVVVTGSRPNFLV